ncbi:MAG: acetyl-CoA carboxylase carboxyl transferase subunit beta [Flavobacteriaceae bacterium]|nr:acetyl-CoA carboxylase carboxyl transferase subunit beta [Flavobacteriaceae bacterium]|tara:strand:+ start:9 stop:869 length:861 start_codon:yes stop_codon:yes gene_type:complete
MNWIKDFIPTIKQNLSKTFGKENDSKIPEGLWKSCNKCGSILYIPELKKNSYVCSKCSNHFKIDVSERIEVTFDENTYKSLNEKEEFKDYLKFKDTKKYKDRFEEASKKTGSDEALSIGTGKIKDIEVVTTIFEFDFLGGSMGAVVGKRFVKAVEYSIEHNLPLISFSTSGGARMQESMISLFQMGKTASAIKKLKNKKIPFISVLVDPCYGGVTASLAMLGDLIIAEPNARIGFSGKRVIQDTVKEDLPKDFQTAEKQLEKGFVDKIVDRRELRNFVSKILKILN